MAAVMRVWKLHVQESRLVQENCDSARWTTVVEHESDIGVSFAHMFEVRFGKRFHRRRRVQVTVVVSDDIAQAAGHEHRHADTASSDVAPRMTHSGAAPVADVMAFGRLDSPLGSTQPRNRVRAGIAVHTVLELGAYASPPDFESFDPSAQARPGQ